MLLALAALCAPGCSKKPKGAAKKIPRDQDAQAVVMIETSDTAPGVEFLDEVEPNDERAQAMALPLGAGVRGSLDGESDADFYVVHVTAPGYLDALVSGIEGVDLILELQDAEGKVLARSDRGPAMLSEGLPNYRVEPGDYYLVVREFVRRRRPPRKTASSKGQAPEGRVGPSPVYELVARLRSEPERQHESEPNDSLEQAAEVLIGDEVFGHIGWHQDVDVWKVSTEGFTSHYGLDIDLDGVPGVTLTLALLDSAGKRVLEREGQKDRGIAVRNLVLVRDDGEAAEEGRESQGAPRYHFIRISARRSNPVEPYRLRLGTRLLDLDDEIEPNDTPDQAMTLGDIASVTRGTRRGSLPFGDVDHFRLDMGARPMFLWVSVKPDAAMDVELQVSVDGQVLGEASARRGGSEATLSDLRVAAHRSAIIKVSGKGAEARDAGYELRWSVDPAAPAELGDERALDLFDDYEDD